MEVGKGRQNRTSDSESAKDGKAELPPVARDTCLEQTDTKSPADATSRAGERDIQHEPTGADVTTGDRLLDAEIDILASYWSKRGRGVDFGDVGALFPRLNKWELATLARLQEHPTFMGRTFQQSEHIGAEVVDDEGRSFDFVGVPAASLHWNADEFFDSIDAHLRKSNDFTVVDVTGFAPDHAAAVSAHLDRMPEAMRRRIVRLGI